MGLTLNEYIYISPYNRQKLYGLELSRDDIIVVGDPNLPFSFYQFLQKRIRK